MDCMSPLYDICRACPAVCLAPPVLLRHTPRPSCAPHDSPNIEWGVCCSAWCGYMGPTASMLGGTSRGRLLPCAKHRPASRLPGRAELCKSCSHCPRGFLGGLGLSTTLACPRTIAPTRKNRERVVPGRPISRWARNACGAPARTPTAPGVASDDRRRLDLMIVSMLLIQKAVPGPSLRCGTVAWVSAVPSGTRRPPIGLFGPTASNSSRTVNLPLLSA